MKPYPEAVKVKQGPRFLSLRVYDSLRDAKEAAAIAEDNMQDLGMEPINYHFRVPGEMWTNDDGTITVVVI
jgi:hypothetical protein